MLICCSLITIKCRDVVTGNINVFLGACGGTIVVLGFVLLWFFGGGKGGGDAPFSMSIISFDSLKSLAK